MQIHRSPMKIVQLFKAGSTVIQSPTRPIGFILLRYKDAALSRESVRVPRVLSKKSLLIGFQLIFLREQSCPLRFTLNSQSRIAVNAIASRIPRIKFSLQRSLATLQRLCFRFSIRIGRGESDRAKQTNEECFHVFKIITSAKNWRDLFLFSLTPV